MSLDVVYVAYNRLEFTRFSFEQLIANTAWDQVERLIVYDDGSKDGTREWLEAAVAHVPVEAELRDVVLRSPPGVMNHYLREAAALWFAKIDNDIVVPPGWLEEMITVVTNVRPAIDLLGMEGGRCGIPGRDGHPTEGHSFEEASHIGGVGLMRRKAFYKPGNRQMRRIPQKGRFGFTEWQWHNSDVVRGWITPDLMVAALDMIPFEPWRSLSELYVDAGWQRSWPTYDRLWTEPLWAWWPEEARREAA